MKSLLKLIAAVALTTTPAMSLVACGDQSHQPTPEDILNLAIGLIADSDINLVSDLLLPDTTKLETMKDKTFSQFDSTIRTKISDFFSKKLKKNSPSNPTSSWYYDDAKVVISDDSAGKANPNQFRIPINPLINGHIVLTATISYKKLPPFVKTINLTINNDSSKVNPNEQAKLIMDFIKPQLANKDVLKINVENLPITGAHDFATNSTQLKNLQQNLREKIIELVDYSGLSLEINYNTSVNPTTFFTMTDPTLPPATLPNVDKTSTVFNGTIANFSITFLVGASAAGRATLDIEDSQPIAINQTFDAATSQITKVFSSRVLPPISGNMPGSDTTYATYIKDNPNIKEQIIKDGFFAEINRVYKNIGQGWDESVITVPNAETAVFNLDATGKTGYFNLSFQLNYTIPQAKVPTTDSKFNISVDNIQIQLFKNN